MSAAIGGAATNALITNSARVESPDQSPSRQPRDPKLPLLRLRRLRVRVIDGDTLALSTGEEVRLIGVDTPETKHPRKPVEAFGKEATAFTRQMVEGKPVRLEFDVQRRDKYQRLLAYACIGEQMLNAELVRHGYAQVVTFPPNARY